MKQALQPTSASGGAGVPPRLPPTAHAGGAMRGTRPPKAFILQSSSWIWGWRRGTGQFQPICYFYFAPEGVAKMGSAGILRSHPKPAGHLLAPQAWSTPSYVTIFSFEPTNCEEIAFLLSCKKATPLSRHLQWTSLPQRSLETSSRDICTPNFFTHQHCRFGDTRVFHKFFSTLSHKNLRELRTEPQTFHNGQRRRILTLWFETTSSFQNSHVVHFFQSKGLIKAQYRNITDSFKTSPSPFQATEVKILKIGFGSPFETLK